MPRDVKGRGAIRHAFQRPARYALWSDGVELELTITTGVIAWYRDRAEARWTLSDAAGKSLRQGRLPQDGQPHPLRLATPAAGLYWFECDDQAAGWRMEASGPAVLALRRSVGPIHMGHMPSVYFFVPKGTRQIEYYWQGGPHDVFGPDGKKAAEVTSSGQFVRVAVPAGMDGQAWSMRRLALGRLWFFNCPNYLAAAPETLLVPDGL